jgi:hypothetical protein
LTPPAQLPSVLSPSVLCYLQPGVCLSSHARLSSLRTFRLLLSGVYTGTDSIAQSATSTIFTHENPFLFSARSAIIHFNFNSIVAGYNSRLRRRRLRFIPSTLANLKTYAEAQIPFIILLLSTNPSKETRWVTVNVVGTLWPGCGTFAVRDIYYHLCSTASCVCKHGRGEGSRVVGLGRAGSTQLFIFTGD